MRKMNTSIFECFLEEWPILVTNRPYLEDGFQVFLVEKIFEKPDDSDRSVIFHGVIHGISQDPVMCEGPQQMSDHFFPFSSCKKTLLKCISKNIWCDQFNF